MQNTRSLQHSSQGSSKSLTAMALALATTLGLTLAFSAQAATITVTSASDAAAPGGCSLRGAVMAINSGNDANGCTSTGTYGNDDTISFSFADQTVITFASEINIEKNLTIHGNGQIRLDGNQATRIFNIIGGTALTIYDLTFQNGVAKHSGDPETGGQVEYGGAIRAAVAGHVLTLARSVFFNNSGYGGGAIYSDAIVKLNNTTFRTNQASYGGAITATDISADHSTFTGNSVSGNGGVILARNHVAVDNSQFSGNNFEQATQNGGNGGAIYSMNTASVSNSILERNTTGLNGGAIYAANGLFVNDSTFKNNLSGYNYGSGQGGAIFATGDIVITGSVFSDNQAGRAGTPNENLGHGGAIGTEGPDTTAIISNSTFIGNSASSGGAIRAGMPNDSAGTIFVSTSTFDGNTAGNYGGAIVATRAHADNSTFVNNSAQENGSKGGAIYARKNLKATYLTLVNNRASSAGAIFVDDFGGANVDISNSLIVDGAGIAAMQCGFNGGFSTASPSRYNIEWRNGDNSLSCNSRVSVMVPDGMSLEQIVSPVLADNGGPTQTLTLPAGSPAIDHGDPAVTGTVDQRGQPRLQGSAPDLGAFEAGTQYNARVDVTTRVEGGITLTTINGRIEPAGQDVGKNGAVFVFVNITGTNDWLLLNPETGWHPWGDCVTTNFPYRDGTLPSGVDIALFYNGDLSPFQGWPVFFGYGVGSDSQAACTDMFYNARYTHVVTL